MSNFAVSEDSERQLREMNAALLVSSVHQHELTDRAEQAREAMRESEERYRILFELVPAAVYSCDAEGAIEKFNRRAAELWGREPALGDASERFCGSLKLFRPDGSFLPHEQCPMAQVLRGQIAEVRDAEMQIERPDGSRISVVSSIRTLRNPRGEVIGAIHCAYDITERKLAEGAIRDSNARFEGLFDASPVGMYLVDADLRIRLLSRIVRSVFGEVVQGDGGRELVGQDFLKVVHVLWPREVAADVVKRFRHTLATGEPYSAPEFSEVRRDRNVREYYDWQLRRIALPEGRFGVVCYFIDVSQRVLAQRDRRRSELRYRRLFESAQDGILILDTISGKIVAANPFMSDLLGYSHDDFFGQELWEIGLFGDKAASEAAVRELQKNGYLRYENLPLESRSGKQVEVEVVANVYTEADHSVIQCTVRDITERSRLERNMHEQAVALADLQRRKDEFLAMLSHELRNPLAPIVNSVQLLRLQENEDPLQRQARGIIERQVGQLTRLIDDLLEVSRFTSGKIRLRLERVEVNGILENAVETVRPLIAQRGQSLHRSLSAQPILLRGDAARLEQVVVNLLTNAAKYTDPGGHIWLSAERDGDEAVLRVQDSGEGISPELLPRIFDLFTQADRSMDRSQGGLGIGLSLVRRLVEMHGGNVVAHSTPGQGSEFVVRLPIDAAAAAPSLPATERAATAGLALRVLVVDDRRDATLVLGTLLKAEGHDVRIADDGPGGLQAALDYLPDVVLLDIGLPGMDGLQVAQRIRREPTLRKVVLIAMTGYGNDEDRQRSKEAGFDHHLVKPADFRKVREILATVAPRTDG